LVIHDVENYIKKILNEHFSTDWEIVYRKSELIQYLNLKSGAIHGNSKSRRSLAAWYAIYSILHFYEINGFVNEKEKYLKSKGTNFSKLFEFQREQYGGEKLQNHALNSRVNAEFNNKISHDANKPLIVIDNGNYQIHPDYLYIVIGDKEVDISLVVIEIIKTYQSILFNKDNSFSRLLNKIEDCPDYKKQKSDLKKLLSEDTEARIFEIMSFVILESHFKNKIVYIGFSRQSINEEYLKLYKTGRTNANDGGIDFVMKPLGRFFQVTEVDNYDKYFLDMDKVNHYPITFVVKTVKDAKSIYNELKRYGDEKSGGLETLQRKYHNAIEDVITINELQLWLDELNEESIRFLIQELNWYYRLEMNIED